jgi:hypothetical protein
MFFETQRKDLFPQTLPYMLQHDIPVPPTGRYQLYLLVRWQPTGKDASLLQGPILRVEG